MLNIFYNVYYIFCAFELPCKFDQSELSKIMFAKYLNLFENHFKWITHV